MHHPENSRIHVALSPWDLTDDYNRHAGVTLLSLLEHSSLPVTAHLLYDANLSKGKEKEEAYNKSCYQKIADKYGCELHFHHVDVPEWVRDIPSVNNYTPGALLRLYLPELLSRVNKIVYLDCDMVVLTDISKLWNNELGDMILGACSDDIRFNVTKKIRDFYTAKGISVESYFNSGTLLLNLKEMREQNFTTKVFEWLSNNKDVLYPDQDMLNWYTQKNYLCLDEKYNVLVRSTIQSNLNDSIIHYLGGEKPWKKYNGEIDNYYWKYLMQTPWCENPENILRYIRDAPDVTKAIPLLQKNFFANIEGNRKEKVSTAAKFTISIWKDFFGGLLSIVKKR